MGGLLAGASGWAMCSDAIHQFNGKPSTATLIEHITECTVEYQRSGEDRRKEPMPCAAAEQLRSFVGSSKIEISRDYLALVRFPLADGRIHEARVAEYQLGSLKLPVGTDIAVVYAPDRPDDVRATLTWGRLEGALTAFAGGLVLLLLALADWIKALFAWAFRRRTPPLAKASRQPTVVGGPAASPAMGSQRAASFGTRK